MTGKKKAVALKYTQGFDAPVISASAQGFWAQKMLEIAAQNNIPVTQNSALTEFLSVQQIGQAVPREAWEAVAKIFAFVVDWSRENA